MKTKPIKISLNKELYSDVLFKVWAEKNNLLEIEQYFLTKYLSNKNGSVIEAGTGGGRLIFEIEKLGFKNLEAFDYVDKMVDFCNVKKEEINSNIKFSVADATNLKQYPKETFDYLIYLQQVLCFVDTNQFKEGLNEARRIGKDTSTYIFSFLNWDSKIYNPLLSIMVNFFRKIRNEKTSKYQLPWLNLNGKFNWKLFNANQPKNIWFKKADVTEILNDCGFNILEVLSGDDVLGTSNVKAGHIYIVCNKII